MKAFKCFVVVTCMFITVDSFAETETARGCYEYGENETLLEAKETAHTIAVRKAVEQGGVNIDAETVTTDGKLAYDIIKLQASKHIKIIESKFERSLQNLEICEKITITFNPNIVSNFINSKSAYNGNSIKIEQRQIDSKTLKAKRYYVEGYDYFYNKKFYRALSMLDKSIKLNDVAADPYYLKGATYLSLKMFDEAEKYFMISTEYSYQYEREKNYTGNKFVSYMWMANYAIFEGKYDKALKILRELEKDSIRYSREEVAVIYNGYSNAYEGKENLNEAIRQSRISLTFDRNSNNLGQLSTILSKSGNDKEALETVSDAIKLSKNISLMATLYYARAGIKMKANISYGNVIEDLINSIRFNPRKEYYTTLIDYANVHKDYVTAIKYKALRDGN